MLCCRAFSVHCPCGLSHPVLPTVPKTAESLCSFPYLLEDGKAVVERVELSSFSSGFLLAKNLLFLSEKKNLEPAQGVKAPLRAASKDGSFSIPAVFSHRCQGQFLLWCSGMSTQYFPRG